MCLALMINPLLQFEAVKSRRLTFLSIVMFTVRLDIVVVLRV